MGYRVVYGAGKREYRRRSGTAALTGLCFLVFLCLVAYFWPQGWAFLQEAVFPEDHGVAAAALDEMTAQIRCEMDLQDAVKSFFSRMKNAAG